MKPRWFALGLLAVCLIVVGRVAATPAGTAAPTPIPGGNFAHYLPIALHDLASDESLDQTATAAAATSTPDPNATATATATSTPMSTQTIGISGTVYVRPRWVEYSPVSSPPVLYEIILDATDAMSYDFAGHGTLGGTIGNQQDTIGGADYQCELSDPIDPLPSTDTCTGGASSPWRHYQERRGYVVKQALDRLIDQMRPLDTMRIIAYSTDVSGMAQASAGWSSDKATLKNAISTLGAYNQDPYRSAGYGSGAIALKKAHDLLATAPLTAPDGQSYKRVMILLSAGVPNVFLDGALNTARDICGNLTVWQAINTADPCQLGATAIGKLRPITAMIDQANVIKASDQLINIYVVSASRGEPGTGLPRVASDASMYYTASQPGMVGSSLDDIQSQNQVSGQVCVPSGGYTWLDRIDAAHTPASPPAPGNGVFGYAYIYDVGGGIPKFTLPIQHDGSTGALGFAIPPPDSGNPSSGIAPGNYEMAAYVDYKGNDGITRQYDYFRTPSLDEVHRITFSVTSASTIGASVPLPPIFMELPSTVSLCPP